MFVIIGLIAGAIVGTLRARARGGKRLDVLQYVVVHAILFAMIGIFMTIFVHRMAA